MRLLAAAALALVFAGASSGAPLKHLTAQDRAQIDRAIDMVVNYGAKRVDVGRSYDWVTPEMRAGMTRKQWAKGDISIYPFPAKGATFHHWTLKWISDGTVGVELLLMPTLKNRFDVGPIIFDLYLRPSGKRWLVDGFMPMATLAPVNAKKPKVRSVADFSPQPAQQGAVAPGGRINSHWLFFPFVAMGAALLAFIGWMLVKWLRERRLMSGRHKTLPPLPPRLSRGA